MFDDITINRSLAGLALLAILATGCSSGPQASATPLAVAIPSGTPPMESTLPTARVTTPSPAPGASASAAPLPNGTYVSGAITKAMIWAGLKDPKVANDPQVTGFIAAFPYAQTVFRMSFDNGQWTQSTVADGRDQGVGDGGTFAFVDDHTMVIQGSSDNCLGTLNFVLRGDSLKWTPLRESCGPAYLAVDRVVFGSTPWTRRP